MIKMDSISYPFLHIVFKFQNDHTIINTMEKKLFVHLFFVVVFIYIYHGMAVLKFPFNMEKK